MFMPVIVAMVCFSLLLFIISLKFKKNDIEQQMEDLSIKHATEMYTINKRLNLLEEEMLAGLEE